jgi:PAS domain S-box-containing protein
LVELVPGRLTSGTPWCLTMPNETGTGWRDLVRGVAAVQAESKFYRLLEAAPDAIVIVDADGRIAMVNQQAERVFGYERAELLGQPIEILLPEQFRAAHVGHRQTYSAAPQTRPMGIGLELYGRRKDGHTFPVEISLSPLESGEELLITSIIRDVTDRKQAEDRLRETANALAHLTVELQRSNAELEQFAYVASHDLQEPLRMVASYTQLLRRRYQGKLDSDADEFIAYAVDGAVRMQQLINDLLIYSRVGRQGPSFESVDTAQLFEQTVVDLAAAIEESGAVVSRGELPVVIGDPVQLSQLFLNLIGNAIKFSKPTPRTEASGQVEAATRPACVHVAAERRPGEWVFSVQDNGIGIEPEYQERIFVIFQRLHNREEYPGTGMGLAICKKIVERHGGRIWLDSRPGEGSTFFVSLPIQEPVP